MILPKLSAITRSESPSVDDHDLALLNDCVRDDSMTKGVGHGLEQLSTISGDPSRSNTIDGR